MKKHIAVIDDEPDILELVTLHLGKGGFATGAYGTAGAFRDSLQQTRPDLIVLDLMLPDGDGFDICRQLKADDDTRDIPVIMLTARTEETDVVLGLELGADDYVTKPFSPRELVARVRSVLRRREKEEKEGRLVAVGDDTVIDCDKFSVARNGEPLDLTTTEIKILLLMAGHPGWVYSRDQILEHLWGQDKVVVDRTVDVHIRHLREKLGETGRKIKNVRGVGYKIEA